MAYDTSRKAQTKLNIGTLSQELATNLRGKGAHTIQSNDGRILLTGWRLSARSCTYRYRKSDLYEEANFSTIYLGTDGTLWVLYEEEREEYGHGVNVHPTKCSAQPLLLDQYDIMDYRGLQRESRPQCRRWGDGLWRTLKNLEEGR